MTDLDLMAQIDEKIHQLPPHLVIETVNFIDCLLQRYRAVYTHDLIDLSEHYQIKPVSLGLKVENIDNIAAILEQYE